MKYIVYATIIGDKMELRDPEKFKKFLTALKYKTKDETKIKLTMQRDIKPRTSNKETEPSNQNGYYWSVVIPILSEYFGYLPDEIHESIKMKFLQVGGDDKFPKLGSTAALNKIDWEELMEKIRIWALTDFNVKIPEPNEVSD